LPPGGKRQKDEITSCLGEASTKNTPDPAKTVTDMNKNYIARLFTSLWHLAQGMGITMRNFLRRKVTEQYPENRGTHEYFERFRALLTMPHDAENRHRCTACGICQLNCPNGTIAVVSRMEDDPATGKPKKVLDKYLYDLGSCTFCNLCVQSCPRSAIEFTNAFEHSVFTKERLVKQLNLPGSSLVVNG
jgi:NADH-quinone oxidoreductase subunit I